MKGAAATGCATTDWAMDTGWATTDPGRSMDMLRGGMVTFTCEGCAALPLASALSSCATNLDDQDGQPTQRLRKAAGTVGIGYLLESRGQGQVVVPLEKRVRAVAQP